MESEIWKVYKESFHPTRGKKVYEVSDQGRVKLNGEVINFDNILHSKYYYFAGILVHRAVAELFIPNPENKPCIDHINGNSHDNKKENLRWCTYTENNNNPITKERQSKAQKETKNKPEFKLKWSEQARIIQNRPEVKEKRNAAIRQAKRNIKQHWMNNGTDERLIKTELVDYYLERGYHFGRK